MAQPLVSDELWCLVEPLIPKVKRRHRYPGRKRIDEAGASLVVPKRAGLVSLGGKSCKSAVSKGARGAPRGSTMVPQLGKPLQMNRFCPRRGRHEGAKGLHPRR
jgi:hypothetical protein